MNTEQEREAFEAWASTYPALEDDEGKVNLRYLGLHKQYVDFDVQRLWRAWQARAALAATPAAPHPDTKDAERYRWLREQHEGCEELAFDAEGLPMPLEPTALAFTVFCPKYGGLEPVGCIPGELDAAIDAAMAAQGKEAGNG